LRSAELPRAMGLLSCCFGGSPAVAPALANAAGGTSRSASVTGSSGNLSRASFAGGSFWPQTMSVLPPAETLISLLSGAQQIELQSAFRQFDLNGNGTIDSKELKSVMARLGHPMTDSQVDNILVRLDTDRSGCVEWDEFAAMMADRWLRMDGTTDMNMALEQVLHQCKTDEEEDDEPFDMKMSQVKELMCSCGEKPFTDEEWNAFVQAADPGGTGRMSAAAFKAMHCWNAAPPNLPSPPKRLSVRPSQGDPAGGASAPVGAPTRQF